MLNSDIKNPELTYKKGVMNKENGECSIEFKLAKFYEEICRSCDNKSCYGVYDEDWREDCELFKEEFKDFVFLPFEGKMK